jgi:hypothetical protein
MIGKIYPEEIKITHWFPTLFFIGTISLFLLPFVSYELSAIGLSAFVLYFTVLFLDSLISNRNPVVAILSVPAALCQLFGYGLGFIKEKLRRNS